jgi:hypothetical protein
VALTPAGKLASSVSVGVVAEVTSTNPNGETIVEAGGAAQKSAAAEVTVSASGRVSAVVEPVAGAAGYAWFAGAEGSERLVAVTGINSVVISALNGAGQLASALANADKSFSDRVYNGLLTLATPSIGAYSKVMATGNAGVGTSWTSDGVGGIEEINEALAWFYDEHKISPTDLFVSAKQFVKLRKAILSADNASIHFQAGSTSGVAGGGSMLPYMNPLGSATGVSTLRIRIHPTIGDSLALFYSDRVPGAVNLPVVSRMLLRHDYRQYSWPTAKRNYEFGVYVDGVLQHYAPFTMGVISNLA